MNRSKKHSENSKELVDNSWRKLFDLIPKIATTKSFGKAPPIKKDSEGTIIYQPIIESDSIIKFRVLIYELDIIKPFNWSNWEYGKNLLLNTTTDYNSLDKNTLCKLITVMIRNDRFVEGYLVGRFKDGTILKILTALKNNYENQN